MHFAVGGFKNPAHDIHADPLHRFSICFYQNLSQKHITLTMTSVATMSTGSGMDKYYSSKIGELNSVSVNLALSGTYVLLTIIAFAVVDANLNDRIFSQISFSKQQQHN